MTFIIKHDSDAVSLFLVVSATIYNCHLRLLYFVQLPSPLKAHEPFHRDQADNTFKSIIINFNLCILSLSGDASDVYLYILLSQSPTPCFIILNWLVNVILCFRLMTFTFKFSKVY